MIDEATRRYYQNEKQKKIEQKKVNTTQHSDLTPSTPASV